MITRISASYKRTIKTGEFQSVTVENGFDEEVSYKTEAELVSRRNELREKAMQQIVDDLQMILERLGLSEKRVFAKGHAAPKELVGNALS